MARIQLRRDTAANWTAANPTLASGEKGIETDTGKEKTGNGTTAWNTLAYLTAAAGPHRATHAVGGSDALTAADLGTGTADASTFLRGDKVWAALPTTIDATTITTATHTAALTDAGKVIRMTFAGASTLTIPANATTAFATGTVINAYAAGGALTIAAAGGVTIRNNAAALAQYGEASLRKDGTDEWVRVG